MQEGENTLRERLCQGGRGPTWEMGGGAPGGELEVGHKQVQPRHLLRVFSSLLFSPPFPCVFIMVVIVVRFILLLSLRSVVGNVPHQQNLGANAAHDRRVPHTHDGAARRVGE